MPRPLRHLPAPSSSPPAWPGLRSLPVLAAALLLAVPAARAQQGVNPGYGWGLGIGAGVTQRPYKDIDTETRALPILSFENQWVKVAGLGVDLKLGSAGPVSFALGARYSLGGYEADDAPILAGMDERKGGVWVGPSAVWRTGVADLSAEVLGDAAGHSKGTQVRLGLEHTLAFGAVRLTPRLGVHWRDSKTVDYYYGVRAHEVRSDRPLYRPGSSTDVELGLRTAYILGRQHSVFMDLSAIGFGNSVTDSPLVDRSSQTSVRLGYLYRF